MCKDCTNYKPLGKKSCYKNKCEGCDCKNCPDSKDCETRQAKCGYCKFIPNGWTITYPYTNTPTITYPWYQPGSVTYQTDQTTYTITGNQSNFP